jgi:hypothetical protein
MKPVDVISHPDGVAEHQAEAVGEPKLLHLGRALAARQSQGAAPLVVCRGDDQDVVGTPDGRGVVHVAAGVVGMAPEQGAGVRIQAVDGLTAKDDQLGFPVDVDEDRRRLCDEEIAARPDRCSIGLPEGHNRLPRPANLQDDGSVVADRTACESGLHGRTRQSRGGVEFTDQIVEPEQFAAGFLKGKELFVGAHGEDAVADDQRCRMRTRAVGEVQRFSRVLVFPDRFAGCGIHRDHDLPRLPRPLPARCGPGPVQRQCDAIVDHDRRVAQTERATPDDRRAVISPGIRQVRPVDDEVALRPTPLGPLVG